jgi:hypothetical protein
VVRNKLENKSELKRIKEQSELTNIMEQVKQCVKLNDYLDAKEETD